MLKYFYQNKKYIKVEDFCFKDILQENALTTQYQTFYLGWTHYLQAFTHYFLPDSNFNLLVFQLA